MMEGMRIRRTSHTLKLRGARRTSGRRRLKSHSPGARRSGILWHPVATCGTGLVALLEDCILEARSPGGLEPGDLEARMMRLGMRMLMNDGKDED